MWIRNRKCWWPHWNCRLWHNTPLNRLKIILNIPYIGLPAPSGRIVAIPLILIVLGKQYSSPGLCLLSAIYLCSVLLCTTKLVGGRLEGINVIMLCKFHYFLVMINGLINKCPISSFPRVLIDFLQIYISLAVQIGAACLLKLCHMTSYRVLNFSQQFMS